MKFAGMAPWQVGAQKVMFTAILLMVVYGAGFIFASVLP